MRKDRLPKATRVRRRVWILTAGILIAGSGRPDAQGPTALESVTPAGTSPGRGGHAGAGRATPTPDPSRAISPGNWPRLHLSDPLGRSVARQALNLAWERLAEIDCAEVLNTFMDRAGHPLNERLRALAVDRQTYLSLVVFIDGSREAPCRTGVIAFTTPGSRVVRICVDELKQTWQKKPEYAVSSLIHEMLHTLGLGEDPPTSAEITRRVSAACRRRR